MVDQPSPNVEGFGSADMTTPFYYGSVHDGHFRADSLEQKLKKKYWKTKQTVIQKLGKNQDEYIVAGDAEIDTKLEKAYHLQSSCTELLQAVHKYMTRLKMVSIQESVMGEHLRTWSETEYTNAGEVMQNVGKLQHKDSKERYKMIPPLLRMHNEFMVFRDSAVRDLNNSIQQLEKGRTEYRAALLWMKDVSEKLHNPDYRDQLVRFREAQATVKDTKRRFEKLKVDLGEKIAMVSASRCNLFSRSLPGYQKEVLGYSDTVANEFHNLLVNLRSHHHHQYKVRRVLEEIRDLEVDEVPFTDRRAADGDEFSSLSLPESRERRPLFDGDDDPMLDLAAPTPDSAKSDVDTDTLKQELDEKTQDTFRRVDDPFSVEEVVEQAGVRDLVLGGIEAELQALQNEVLNPREVPMGGAKSPRTQTSPEVSRPQGNVEVEEEGVELEKSQAGIEIDDLLKLGDGLVDDQALLSALSQQEAGPAGEEKDQLVNEWDNFSAFMSTTRDQSKSPLSGWEKEWVGSNAATPSLDSILAPSSLGLDAADSATLPSTVKTEDVTDDNTEFNPMVSATPSEPLPSSDVISAETLPSSDVTSAETLPSGSSDVTSAGPLPSTSPEPLPPLSGAPQNNTSSMDGLLGLGKAGADSADAGAADDLLSEELKSLGLSPPKSQNSTPSSSGLGSINSSLFQLHSTQHYYQPPATSQGPPMFPAQGGVGIGATPPKFGLVSPSTQPPVAGQAAMAPGVGVAKEDDKKGTSWMNFFAHLDPLVNEKA